MSVGMTVRPASPSEDLYAWRQSAQIQSQTGCIGHLRADMDTEGDPFSYVWEDHCSRLKTEPFIKEFQEVIDRLRFGALDENGIRHEDRETFLKSRSALETYCRNNLSAQMHPEEDYFGFRADTEDYTYLLRLNPSADGNNLYCYCYRRDWLDQHLENASRGIRFIDSRYRDLFRIPDGGRVRVTFYDGTVRDVPCRYVDEYHLEFGDSICNLYHICELAEKMENNGNKVEPLDGMPERGKKNRDRGNER